MKKNLYFNPEEVNIILRSLRHSLLDLKVLRDSYQNKLSSATDDFDLRLLSANLRIASSKMDKYLTLIDKFISYQG